MKKEHYGVHVAHCCKKCGCKYGDDDCPVVSGEVVVNHECNDRECGCDEVYKVDWDKIRDRDTEAYSIICDFDENIPGTWDNAKIDKVEILWMRNPKFEEQGD